MLIVGFGIFGFCDIITLFRPIYAHNKHIMAHLRIPPISKRRWVFNSLGTILWPNPRIFAECFLECTNRWSEMACGKNGWGRASSPLTEFFERFSPFFEPKSPFSNRNQPKIGLYLNGRGKNWNSLVLKDMLLLASATFWPRKFSI